MNNIALITGNTQSRASSRPCTDCHFSYLYAKLNLSIGQLHLGLAGLGHGQVQPPVDALQLGWEEGSSFQPLHHHTTLASPRLREEGSLCQRERGGRGGNERGNGRGEGGMGGRKEVVQVNFIPSPLSLPTLSPQCEGGEIEGADESSVGVEEHSS